jgi:hypothetical protein
MDVLYRHFLLALAAMPRKFTRACWPGSGFRGALLASDREHGAPIAFHAGVVGRQQLSGYHPLRFVFRVDPDKRTGRGLVLAVPCFIIGMPRPERISRLVDENEIPMIRLGSSERLLSSLSRLGVGDINCNGLLARRSFLCRHL